MGQENHTYNFLLLNDLDTRKRVLKLVFRQDLVFYSVCVMHMHINSCPRIDVYLFIKGLLLKHKTFCLCQFAYWNSFGDKNKIKLSNS